MTWLIAGVLVWSVVHFIPSLGRSLRTQLIKSLGEIPYKIGFAIMMVASIVLMVIGWRSTLPALVYQPPVWGHPAAGLLMLIASILFACAHGTTNIKRFIRHPQLTGVIVWMAAHLLANGDDRSLILFGGIGVWAIIEIVLINQRDGAWQKPDPLPLKTEIKPVLSGIVAFVVLLFAHPYLFGVSPMAH